jgi:transcriptional regulator with XRE-family HTH domain
VEASSPVDFRLLQLRLVSHVRARVRNGELSERALARITGISQPHIHNVLKGNRLLSPDLADQMLQRMRISLVDLLTAADAAAPPHQEPGDCPDCRMAALLDGWIGREYPYPQAASRQRYPFPAAALDSLDFPVAARLAPDPLRAPMFSGPGVVLLDCSEDVRRDPDEEGYFALDLGGGGTIAMVRLAMRHVYLWARHADVWQSIPLPDRRPLDVIQGRVSLVVRQL